jgi:molybdopterin-binding protein
MKLSRIGDTAKDAARVDSGPPTTGDEAVSAQVFVLPVRPFARSRRRTGDSLASDLVANQVNGPASNRFRGTVISIVADAVLGEVRVLAPCGVLTAVLPRREIAAMHLSVGVTVEVSFRATKVALARCLPGVPTCYHAGPGKS